MNYENYAINLVEKTDSLTYLDKVKEAEVAMRKIAQIAVAEYSKKQESIINSAITIYVFIDSVVPEANLIRYESDARFWLRIGSERFIVEISKNEINVYQFVIGQLWKETDLSMELKVKLNDAAVSYGVF